MSGTTCFPSLKKTPQWKDPDQNKSGIWLVSATPGAFKFLCSLSPLALSTFTTAALTRFFIAPFGFQPPENAIFL
jgi:hypothetical protein